MCPTYSTTLLCAYLFFCVKKYMFLSTEKWLTFCYRYRGHVPRLNRIVGVRLGPSRAAGHAPTAPPGPPSAPSPDPALGQNLGTLIFNEIPCDHIL